MSDRASSTLWAAISHHGFGHLGQMAPVLNRLAQERPDVKIVIQTGHPLSLLQRFLAFSFAHVSLAADEPLAMKNAITLDIPAILSTLDAYHAGADNVITQLSASMQKHQANLVISNIGYFPLKAARCVGLPSVGFCSLNWADILAAYVYDAPALQKHILFIQRCYAAADVFLAPRPFMPMPSINNVQIVGPVARCGTKQSLATLLQRDPDTRFGLVSLGGISYPLRYLDWPQIEGWSWIVAEPQCVRPDLINLQDISLAFSDVLSSVDVLVTKPGYGNIAEAGCAGIPVACLPRPDWPETEALLDWLNEKVPVLMIEEADLHSGRCLAAVAHWREAMTAMPTRSAASGVQQVVDYISNRLP